MPLNLLTAAVLVLGIGGLVYAQKQASVPAAAIGADPALTDIVAAHNTRESCWSIINGNVYDLTSWIPQHPGGEQGILQLCGTDGSAKFNGQHGGSARQESILAGFKIDPGTGGAAGTAAGAPAVAPTAPAGEDEDSGRNRRGRDDEPGDDRGGDND